MMKHMMKHKTVFFGACILAVLMSVPASAILIPQPLATDPRIKVVSYAPNEVIKYTGYYRVQTSWEFPADETIQTISLGDSVGWMMQPAGNRLFIKPVEQDASTNMTLITDRHVYLFELHAAEAKGVDDKDVTWILRILYPSGDESGLVVNGGLDPVPDLDSEDLSKYNFRYTVSGSEDITPIRIFDDGEFTYFEFRDRNGEIPAFYMVDGQNNETIVNYRTRGPFIVVERVVPRYTLRHGNSVVCVFNEAMSGRRQVTTASSGSSSGNSGGSPMLK
jgi:type IV secretion system protein VirB9